MPASDALSWYSQIYDTVEVNTTFHALPSEATVRSWYSRTPPGFTFALKFPREITHDLRLDWPAAEPLTRAFLHLAEQLDDKRGPLLLQLPPSFWRSPANRRTLATFLDALPTDTLQVAVELRHRSWADGSVERALAERNIAWCVVDGNTPNHRALLFPADFVYVRWNRSGATFDGFSHLQDDRSADLDWWAERLLSLPPRIRSVYGYMANEFAGFAPDSLAMLGQRLAVPMVDPRSRWPQGVLF